MQYKDIKQAAALLGNAMKCAEDTVRYTGDARAVLNKSIAGQKRRQGENNDLDTIITTDDALYYMGLLNAIEYKSTKKLSDILFMLKNNMQNNYDGDIPEDDMMKIRQHFKDLARETSDLAGIAKDMRIIGKSI